MAGRHHKLDGHVFEWTLGVGDGQKGLVCCNSWGCKESDMTSYWTELNWKCTQEQFLVTSSISLIFLPASGIQGMCAVHAKSLQMCLPLCDPMDYSPPGSSVHGDSPDKNTGVGCHALLQGIFLTQRSNACLLHLLHWQACSLSKTPEAHGLVWAESKQGSQDPGRTFVLPSKRI